MIIDYTNINLKWLTKLLHITLHIVKKGRRFNEYLDGKQKINIWTKYKKFWL